MIISIPAKREFRFWARLLQWLCLGISLGFAAILIDEAVFVPLFFTLSWCFFVLAYVIHHLRELIRY